MPQDIDQSTASETVFGNLGVDPAEFDADVDDAPEPDDTGPDDDSDDGADGDEREAVREPELDDLSEDRVSHTREDRPETRQQRQFAKPDVKADRAGNLRAPDGTIVARAGREARYYQGMHKARSEVNNLRGQAASATSRLNEAVEIGTGLVKEVQRLQAAVRAAGEGSNETAKSLGLDNAETIEALQLFHLGKTNPTELLKKILTRATMAGIDVKSLGLSGGIDAKSLVDTIKQVLDDRMKPLTERTQTEQARAAEQERYNDILADTTRDVNQFFADNPRATPFLPVFQEAMKSFPKMTLGEVWAHIRLNLAQRQRSQTNSGNGSKPLPSSRGGSRNSNGRDVDPMSLLEKDYGAILNGVFDELGTPAQGR